MVLFIIFFFIREPFFVRLREHDYDPGENTVNNFPEDFQISDIIFHPNYKLDQGYDDVALLKLAKEATYKVKLFFLLFPIQLKYTWMRFLIGIS